MTVGNSTALVLIDVQKGFDEPSWGERNNPDAEQHIANLLQAWREAHRPVIHVQHMSVMPKSPLRPGQGGNAFKSEGMPLANEPIFQKQVNSAFIGTDLEGYLRTHGIDRLVITGLTTDHCVSTTVRMAANLGFSVVVVADATATFERTGPDGEHYTAEQMHRLALASLYGEFAAVSSSRELLASIKGAGDA